MKYFKRIKEIKSTYTKMLLSYIILLFFGVATINIITLINYNYWLKRELQNYNFQLIRKSSQNVDNTLSSVYHSIYQVSKDPYLLKIVKETNITLKDTAPLIKYIDNIKVTEPILHSVNLYSENSDLIISTLTPPSKSALFFDNKWLSEYENNSNSIVWMEPRSITVKYENYETETLNVISIIIKITDNGKDYGAIVANINENDFVKYIMSLHDESTQVMVLQNDFKILCSSDKSILGKYFNGLQEQLKNMGNSGYLEFTYNNSKSTFFFANSDVNDWKYACLVPTNIVNQKGIQLFRQTLIISLLFIILGLFLAHKITGKFYKPVNDLLTKLSINKTKNINEYDIIGNYLDKLKDERQHFEDEFNKNIPALIERFMLSFLNGKLMMSNETIKENLAFYNISFKSYRVVCLKAEYISDENHIVNINIFNLKLKLYLQEELEAHYSLIFENEWNCIILITELTDEESLNQIIHSALTENSTYNLHAYAGISEIGNNPICIKEAYLNALTALNHRTLKESNDIIYYEDLTSKDKNIYDLSLVSEYQNNIIKSLKKYDKNEIYTTIDDLFNNITTNSYINVDDLHQVVLFLLGNIFKSLTDMNLNIQSINKLINEIYYNTLNYSSIDYIKDGLKNIFDEIVDYIEFNKNPKKDNLFSQIDVSIKANYMDYNFSLETLSDTFNLSTVYIGKLIKESTGLSFQQYINDIRLEKAKELLSTTDYNINEISDKVGYINVNSFCRFFKNNLGITPTEFRSTIQ